MGFDPKIDAGRLAAHRTATPGEDTSLILSFEGAWSRVKACGMTNVLLAAV